MTLSENIWRSAAALATALVDCGNFAMADWFLNAAGLDSVTAAGGAVVWALGIANGAKVLTDEPIEPWSDAS